MLRTICLVWFILAAFAAPRFSTSDEPVRVYIGTYTGNGSPSEGIYAADFDSSAGALGTPRLVARAENPSFLAIHPSGKFLYAANETREFQGAPSGAVSAFSIEPKKGDLTLLNQLASGGESPCHISLDPSAKLLFAANYHSGNLAAFKLAPDGKLAARTALIQHRGKSVDPARQEAPHAHAVNTDASGKFLFANDLGIDKVLIYRVDAAKGTLTANDPPALNVKPGSGPRHLAIKGNFVYVLNEMGDSVTTFAFDFEKGTAKELQTVSTLPEDFQDPAANGCAEIVAHPTLPFIYASNRGHDSLAIFERDSATGKLTPRGHVKTGFKTPRNFAFDPSGKYCLVGSQTTNEVYIHKLDEKTGQMELVGNPVKVGQPVCFRFMPVAKP